MARTKAANVKINKNMSLVELQGVLGDRIALTLKEDKTPEERQMDNEQSYLIMNIAKQMINNGTLILNIEKLAAQNRNLDELVSLSLINGPA